MFFQDYKSKIVTGIEEDDLEDKLSGSNNANKREKKSLKIFTVLTKQENSWQCLNMMKLVKFKKKKWIEQKDKHELWIKVKMQNSVKVNN